jgi:hypothetical protein
MITSTTNVLLLVMNLVQPDYYKMAHGKAWQGK